MGNSAHSRPNTVFPGRNAQVSRKMKNQENEVGKTNILMEGKMENILTNGGSI